MSTVERYEPDSEIITEFEALRIASPSVLDAIPGAMYLCDEEGRLVCYNKEAADLWGRKPKLGSLQERFCGSYALFLADGKPLPHSECPMARAVLDGITVRNAEVVIERPDGTRITALVNIRPLKDPYGRIQGAINCFHDISQRKSTEDEFRRNRQELEDFFETERCEAESALREREQHMRELLEGLPAAIYTTDAEGRITFFNKAVVELAGRTPNLGSDQWCVTWKLYWPDGTPMRHDECPMSVALKSRRRIAGEEALAERPDGTRVPVMAYPTPLFSADARLIGAINMLVDITDRKRAETHQKILIEELNHRVKNTLAMVQSLAIQTARHASSLTDFVGTFEARLLALARAHDLLTKRRWYGASLGVLVEEVVAPFADGTDRTKVDGAAIEVNPRTALSLTMALNELTTNAAKYGALSVENGSLSITWTVRRDGDSAIVDLDWCEQGGPPVVAPSRRGFGTRLMTLCIESDLGGQVELHFDPSGVRCHMTFVAGLTAPT